MKLTSCQVRFYQPLGFNDGPSSMWDVINARLLNNLETYPNSSAEFKPPARCPLVGWT